LAAALVAVLALNVTSRRVALTPGDVLAQEQKQMHGEMVGVWEGTTVAICPGSPANRCNAQQKVTITLGMAQALELVGLA
jgi:hypothetical protein